MHSNDLCLNCILRLRNDLPLLSHLLLQLPNLCLCLLHALLLLRDKHGDLPFKLDYPLHHPLPLFVLRRDLSIVRILHRLAQVIVRNLVIPHKSVR